MLLNLNINRIWLLNFLLVTNIIFGVCENENTSSVEEFIICRHCGADIADSHYISYIPSPQSDVYSNQSILGKANVNVQILVNPHGIKFQVINTLKALCLGVGEWHNAHSWYPGFAWKHCICPQCQAHLGWLFEPLASASPERTKASEDGFYALIIDGLLSEKLISSMLMMHGSHN